MPNDFTCDVFSNRASRIDVSAKIPRRHTGRPYCGLFGADPTVIGRTLRLTGRDYTIVGILRRDFSFGDPAARFWIPLALTDRQRSDEARHRNGWFSIGRLRPGATVEQARDQLKAMDVANFERTPPRLKSILTNTGFYTGVEPLQEVLVRDVRAPLYLLWGAALAVVVIGVANLGTIALARSRARLSDLGTRLALGASRFDIVRQLLVEGFLIAAGGAAGGLALATWMLSTLRFMQQGTAQLHVDAGAVGITLGVSALAGLLMSLVSASPLLTMRLGTMLHAGLRGATRGRAVRATWRTLIVAQMTCSFALLMGSALLYVSLRNLLAMDPGFRTDNVISGIMSLSGPRYAADDAARAFVNRALESIRRLPGVSAAGATTIVPMSGNAQTGIVIAEGYAPAPGEPVVSGVRSMVTPGYFEAVGTPLLRGRYFDERDEDPTSRNIVIDERLARRFWPDGAAVGRRMFCPITSSQLATLGANTRWLTVIGVVRSARLNGPAAEESPSGTSGTYYLPYSVTAPREVGYVIRTDRNPSGIVQEVRSALAHIDRELREAPYSDVCGRGNHRQEFQCLSLAGLGGLSVRLSVRAAKTAPPEPPGGKSLDPGTRLNRWIYWEKRRWSADFRLANRRLHAASRISQLRKLSRLVSQPLADLS